MTIFYLCYSGTQGIDFFPKLFNERCRFKWTKAPEQTYTERRSRHLGKFHEKELIRNLKAAVIPSRPWGLLGLRPGSLNPKCAKLKVL